MKKKITSNSWLVVFLLLPVFCMGQQKSIPDSLDRDNRFNIKEIIENIGEAFRPDISEKRIAKQLIVELDPNIFNSGSIDSLIQKWKAEYSLKKIEVEDSCNCGRLIYLLELESKKDVETLSKSQTSQNATKVDGNELIELENCPQDKKGYELSNITMNNAVFERMVTVYILDTGADTRKWREAPKFMVDPAPKYDCMDDVQDSEGYNYVCPNKVNHCYKDRNGHGTFGIRAITDGMQTDSLRVIPLKIFNKKGKGTFFSMICAMYHAIDHGADIINLSGGYSAPPSDTSSIMENVILAAMDKGAFIVSAAGNDNIPMDIALRTEEDNGNSMDITLPTGKVRFPATYSNRLVSGSSENSRIAPSSRCSVNNIISVASLNPKDSLRSDFSSYGRNSIEIATFGEKIFGYSCNGRRIVSSGTSMAAFYATKVLAIEVGKYPKGEPCDTILGSFTTPLPACETAAKKCLYIDHEMKTVPNKDLIINWLTGNARKRFD